MTIVKRPSLFPWAVALAVGFVLGAAHHLDGMPSELEAAQAVAEDAAAAPLQAASTQGLEAP